MYVKFGLRMFSRWPELPIQPLTTDPADVYPAATFSPHVLAEKPARASRVPAFDPSDPVWVIELWDA